MASADPQAAASAPSPGPGLVLFAYDGSELADHAIEQAGRELADGREALVLCVWQPADVGFVPPAELRFDADEATEVRSAAEQTAAHGASLAERVGFRAESLAVQAAPTWKGIVEVAEQRRPSLIVLGPHGRSGIAGRLFGSVTAAVLAHCEFSVLAVHRQS